jgi:CRP-like cAMP-binding protein
MPVSANRILASLKQEEFALLEPHLEHVDLPVRTNLEIRGKRIDAVYFIESGFASVVAEGTSKPGIEVGIIGREGMTGIEIVLGGDRAPHATYIQLPGRGQRMNIVHLREADAQIPSFHRAMLGYVREFLAQTTATALANGRSKIDERLARWLLMAHDRVDGDELPLTHELLSLMLGSHRPGVTLALQVLEDAGLIARRRGKIKILDRSGLEKRSNGSYVPAEG